jgi:hypothetical protein
MTAGHAMDRAAAPSSAQPLDRSDFTSLKLVPSQPKRAMATAQIQRRRFLSHQRYEKGNLSSAKRLLTLLHCFLKLAVFWQTVAHLSGSTGSVPGNRALTRT